MEKLYRKVSQAFFLRLGTVGFQFLYNILLAKQIGASGIGIYQFALTFSSFIVVVSLLGFPETLVKIISVAYSEKDWGTIRTICKKTFSLSIILAILLSVFLFLSSNFIVSVIFSKSLEVVTAVQWMSFCILPLVLQQLFTGLFRAINKFEISILINGLFTSILGILLISFSNLNTQKIIEVYSIILFVNILLAFYFFYKLFQPIFISLPKIFDLKLIFETSRPLLTIGIVGVLMEAGDILLLGKLMDNKSIGIYSISKKIASLSNFILVVFITVTAQEFSILYSRGEIKTLKHLVNKITKILTVIAIPVLVFFIIYASWILSWFGNDFQSGKNALIILSFGQFVNTVTGPVGNLLIMCGFSNLLRSNYLIVLLISLFLSIILIPRYGIIGSSLASAIGLSLQNIAAFFLVKKKIFNSKYE